MARYKNEGGLHYEPGNATPFKKGSVIESDRDLEKLYPNKFTLMVEGSGVSAKRPVDEERREAVQGLIDDGVWQEEDRDFLEQLKDSDFGRILRQSAPPKVANAAAPAAKKKGRISAKPSVFGDEVTDRYQRAYDEGLHVYVNAQGKYQVLKGNEKHPLNEAPLEEEQVEAFIAEYLAKE